MKLLRLFLAVTVFLGAVIPAAVARDTASIDFFYDNLAPYGSWRDVGDYGYCWQPFDVDSQWQPYSDGRWVFTDAGWTWDSYEPYGWAVYHYGRWANVYGVGWVWVPGAEWGPGWVSWRHSPRYVGWAPLPPEAQFLRAIGFSVWVDDYYDIGPGNFRFVENRDFGAQRLNTVFVDRRQNIEIIHQTTNVTNITYVNNVVYNGGPQYDQQARQSAVPIQRYRLDRRQDFEGDPRRQTAEHLRSRVSGDSLSVLALPFTQHASAPPQRLAEKVGRAEVNHGWKNAGSPAEVNALRDRMKSKVSVPDQLPSQPRFERQSLPQKPRDDAPRVQPLVQPSKGKSNRDDNPRNPSAPPMTPEKVRPNADRPPAPVPEVKKAVIPGAQRPSDSLVPPGRSKMGDPRVPRPGLMPPSEVRKPEREKVVPPQHRMQPNLPEPKPQSPVRPERPANVRPSQRPQVSPTPPPVPPRPEPKRPDSRPAPVVKPSVPSPRPPPAVQPPSRGKSQDDGNRSSKGRKKPTDEPK